MLSQLKSPAPKPSGFRAFQYRLFANIFANELFVTTINKVVPISTT